MHLGGVNTKVLTPFFVYGLIYSAALGFVQMINLKFNSVCLVVHAATEREGFVFIFFDKFSIYQKK
jgi:hypothetical protein